MANNITGLDSLIPYVNFSLLNNEAQEDNTSPIIEENPFSVRSTINSYVKEPIISSTNNNWYKDFTSSLEPIEINEDSTIPSKAKVSKGSSSFNKYFDEVLKEDPSASKYRNLLTKTAELESGFRSNIVNPNSKTRGYFQFRDSTLQGLGTSWMNIKNDPKQQIRYAIKLARQSESQLTQEDRLKASRMGITLNGLIGGAWLGGIGGVRRFLHKGINATDRKWDPNNAGTSIKERMLATNF